MSTPSLLPRGLTGLTVRELEALLASRTRALAAAKWIYGARPWESTIPAALPGIAPAAWARVRAACSMPAVTVTAQAHAADGTIKLLLALTGGAIETVMIPATARSTVCVSSQVGCTRSCKFCATATLGFTRNLTAAEIVAQYLIARTLAPPGAPASNVVFMGMGEPMDNLDAVLTAVEVLTQAPAPQLGHAQVTVSTSGVLPGMRRFLAESRASLALSLNGSTDEQRTAVMPHNKTWPIAALLDLLREDRTAHPRRVHFIEYVMFDGVNDSDDDAARIVGLLAGINARLNVIAHNPIAGSSLRASPIARIQAFHRVASAGGLRCMVRWPRGQDIAAACGQLARTA
ncbi:MAG: 23S rRNA (adenine(2503)-C(2))-methyltransferase RlmN [Myxococcota bacterium]|nr:23S rRNA (adenine(2503)-C(2))-methyltransferase RlmN [Myxococcota bacterium]